MIKKHKLITLSFLTIFLITIFSILPVIASTNQDDFDGKEITETDPIIQRVDKNFDASAIDSDSSDFPESAKFEIEAKSGSIFTIFWEHNTTHLHAFVSAEVGGYVAMGWRSDKPDALGPGVMAGTNIIIGQQLSNGTQVVRDDFGINSNHAPDTAINGTDDITFSSVVSSSGITSLEFVYPLETGDLTQTQNGLKSDNNLSLTGDNWAYFIVSGTESADTVGTNPITGNQNEIMMTYHSDNRHVISKPVYLQQSSENYPESLKEASNIIEKPLPDQGLNFDFINAVLGNLISDGFIENAVIPITAMAFFLVFIGLGLAYLIINARKNKWNISSTIVPVGIIVVFIITIFLLPLPRISETHLEDSEVDVQIVIEAQIKPWTFNATVYQNKLLNPEITSFVDPEEVYAGRAYHENQLINESIRQMLGVDYITDPDYGGLKTVDMTVFYGQTVRFVIKALDTEHGFVLGAEAKPEVDYFGNPLVRTLPQHEVQELYWTAPSEDFDIEYRCTFFCGAGHAGMFARLNVIAPPET